MSATVPIPTVSAAAVRALLDAAVAAAADRGRFSVAVSDPHGNLAGFLRMDGASLASTGIARDKAYAAAAYGRPTHAWAEVLAADEPLRLGASAGALERVVPFGGGVPLLDEDGRRVGGLGISGAHHHVDTAVAEEAVAAVAGLHTP